jgi:hypothetical protein
MENGVSPVYLAAQESGTSTFLTVILMYIKGQTYEMNAFGRRDIYKMKGKLSFGVGI